MKTGYLMRMLSCKIRFAGVLKSLVFCMFCNALLTGALYGNVPGTVDAVSGWFLAGAELTITASPETYRDVDWRGDTDNASLTDTQMTFTVDGPREIDVVFIDQVTSQGTPLWWLAEQSGGELTEDPEDLENQTTASGMTMWEAYVTGMSTTAPESVFAIARVTFANGKPVLEWNHDSTPPRPIRIQFKTDLMDQEEEWDTVGTVDAEGGTNFFDDHDPQGVRGYYRLSVDL